MEFMKLEDAIKKIRKTKERKFNQTIDLIVNLKKFDVKKTQINFFITLPNKIKDKRICGFIEVKTDLINTIPKSSFIKYKNKKELKSLVKKYDFFISSGANMPSVATTFGRVLGPAGKMPSPKLGILANESKEEIIKLIEKINSVVRIQTKEPSIKIKIGTEKMEDKAIIDNLKTAHNAIVNELPKGKENIKSVIIKLTMGKPIKIDV